MSWLHLLFCTNLKNKKNITLSTKVHLVKAMVFPEVHVWMWELDCEEGWAPKNWCFWTVVLEKTLESPLDCKKIQPVHSEGDQSWVFFGRNDAKAEAPVLWPPHAKSWLIGKDSDGCGKPARGEKSVCQCRFNPWVGRTPGEGNGNSLKYSCLGNLIDRGSWKATVHWVQRVRHYWATKPQQNNNYAHYIWKF